MANPETFYKWRRARALERIKKHPGIIHSQLLRSFSNVNTATLKTMLADMAEHDEITIGTVQDEHSSGRPATSYYATGRTTRQDAPQSTQGAFNGKYHVPSQEARDYFVMMIKGCDPDRIDWGTIEDIVTEAYK